MWNVDMFTPDLNLGAEFGFAIEAEREKDAPPTVRLQDAVSIRFGNSRAPP